MTKFSAGFIEEWSQWFTPCNWYDFHIVHCYFENDWKFGQFDFRFIILGVGFWITYTYNGNTEFRREIMKQVEELDLTDRTKTSNTRPSLTMEQLTNV